jgi:hypothetical protein
MSSDTVDRIKNQRRMGKPRRRAHVWLNTLRQQREAAADGKGSDKYKIWLYTSLPVIKQTPSGLRYLFRCNAGGSK